MVYNKENIMLKNSFKQVWKMRYSHQALSSSNMHNIEVDIRYEYDLTEQF